MTNSDVIRPLLNFAYLVLHIYYFAIILLRLFGKLKYNIRLANIALFQYEHMLHG